MSNQEADFRANAISRNPTTGTLMKAYPFQTSKETDRVVAAGAAAYAAWRTAPMAERVACHRGRGNEERPG